MRIESLYIFSFNQFETVSTTVKGASALIGALTYLRCNLFKRIIKKIVYISFGLIIIKRIIYLPSRQSLGHLLEKAFGLFLDVGRKLVYPC